MIGADYCMEYNTFIFFCIQGLYTWMIFDDFDGNDFGDYAVC